MRRRLSLFAALGLLVLFSYCGPRMVETETKVVILGFDGVDPDLIRQYLDESLCEAPLWLAHYDIKLPERCSGWSRWLFLQYTDKGAVSGINGNVDLNEYGGDLDSLISLVRAGDPKN